MPTVHIVLANTAELDWEIKHVDIKSAYLNMDWVTACAKQQILTPAEETVLLNWAV